MTTYRASRSVSKEVAAWTRNVVLVLLCLLVLTSCQGIGPSPDQPQATDLLTSPDPTEPIDTQVVSNYETPVPTEVPLLSPTPYVPLATPEFSIPLQESEMRDPWRPPVYPVPWIPSPYDHFYFTSPIAAYDIDSAYSTYGYGGVFFENVVHTGIDIPGDIGTPILAAGSGTVIYAGQGIYRGGNNIYDDPYGKAVVIEHDFSYQGEPLFTLYAHMDEILVEKGQYVKTGDQIGLMGKTGKTTGPHLHFEVRLGKNEYFSTRNPDLWISPPQGWGVLVGQVHTYVGYPLEQQTVYLYPTEDNPVIGPVNDVGWIATSYQNDAINPDPHYLENFTLANLPAGKYYVYIPATSIGLTYSKEIEIKPGQVTFFRFNLWAGFSEPKLPTPENNFSPSP
jgi:murein DD-endopeptidase MepM/ murein hydrolase activator NlpD